MKRVQLQLPDSVVAWIDLHAEGIESRASFVRRTLVQVMRAEHQGPEPLRNIGIHPVVPQACGRPAPGPPLA